MTHVKFTSIDAFKAVWITHTRRANYPVVTYQKVIKLHGCFSAGSLVTLANGEQIPIETVEIGTSILSYNENTKTVEFDTVTAVMSKDIDIEWLKLDFDDGSSIECTADHLFLTQNRGWVEAQHLEESDIFVEI